jgi:hypothetical protein
MLRSIGLGYPELFVVAVVFGVLVIATIPFCKISARLGFSKWWGLLNLCSLGTLIWAYYIGFSKWPQGPSPR